MKVEKFDPKKDYKNIRKLFDDDGNFIKAEFTFMQGKVPRQEVFTEDSYIGYTDIYPDIWQRIDPESEEFKNFWEEKK